MPKTILNGSTKSPLGYAEGRDGNQAPLVSAHEFLTILRGAWNGEPFSFHGRHLWVDGAKTLPFEQRPEIYFGGSSTAAIGVATRHADVYLTWAEPPAQVDSHLGRVRALAQENGRELRFGIRLHVVTRDSADEAWAAAGALIADADDEIVAAAQRELSTTSAVGQRRMVELHGGRRDSLEVYPNLWAGIGLLRGGAGTALVGSHEQVADRIAEYHRLGITEFILSGYPHLEEACQFGEGVTPVLRERGLLDEPVLV
jgi:alkanesulfonate monooxygenase